MRSTSDELTIKAESARNTIQAKSGETQQCAVCTSLKDCSNQQVECREGSERVYVGREQ